MSNSTAKLLKDAFLDQVPLLSVVLTFLGLVQAVRGIEIESTPNGVSTAITPDGPGMLSTFIGAALLAYALFLLKKRDNWIFYYVLAFPVLTIFIYPYGLVVGLIFIGYAVAKRKEFFAKK